MDKKIALINPENTDKCFQYAATLVLNYDEIESYPERVSNIKRFVNKRNWKGTNYPLKIDDWKTSEKNNPTIALHILYFKENKYVQLQNFIPVVKTNKSVNDSKQRKRRSRSSFRKRMALPCSKKVSTLLQRSNIKTSWSFLLHKLSSLF